ncbi:TonB-dependent receptor plug domain-containing protein [Aureitalea marina]|uniref:TonB-dependent receptor plug domain-containing protein n=1 Tax=Aureitalea marina TaxID=930804 RepID=UPI000CF2D867|nr:TonB-dependent receptor plug domain-containing protein [Aureitalea marina]
MKSLLWTAACLVVAQLGWSQSINQLQQLDSVFIESKNNLDRQDSGRVTTIISEEELSTQAGNSLAQVLNQVAGIEINGARSNAGQNLGYYVRGGRNRQVVIMLDGVQLNDPSSISNDFDLRLIPASSVEQIEIIKGASSVLYGSGAATAVISITTKKVGEDPISGQFASTLASNRSTEEGGYGPAEIVNSAQIGGTSSGFSYDIRLDHRFTDGISAVAAPEGEPAFEADIFNRYNTRLELGYQFKNGPKISRFVSKDRFKADFDEFSYVDADNRTISDQVRTGGNLNWQFGKGAWVLNDSHSWLERETDSGFPTRFESTSSTFDTYFSYPVHQSLTVLVGVNANWSRFSGFSVLFGGTDLEETVSDDLARFDIIDPYLNLTYISDFGLNVNAGVRMNNHSDYGQNWVYQVNPSYRFDLGSGVMRILASYSTAYITPPYFSFMIRSMGTPSCSRKRIKPSKGAWNIRWLETGDSVRSILTARINSLSIL